MVCANNTGIIPGLISFDDLHYISFPICIIIEVSSNNLGGAPLFFSVDSSMPATVYAHVCPELSFFIQTLYWLFYRVSRSRHVFIKKNKLYICYCLHTGFYALPNVKL